MLATAIYRLIVTTALANLITAGGAVADAAAAAAAANTKSSASSSTIYINYTVQEETPGGAELGNLIVDGHLADIYDRAVLDRLKFFTLDGASSGDKWVKKSVEIDRSSGAVRLATKPDREQLCPREVTCQGHIEIALSPAQYFRLIRVLITITDINDHAPSFPVSTENLLLSESVPVGSRLYIPEADDADTGNFGIVRYEILPITGADSDTFIVSHSDMSASSGSLALVLKKALDREVTPIVTIAIVAYDGGSSANSASLVVNITLEDANDNSPTFSQVAYSFQVPEDAPIGTTVGIISAADSDLDSNGFVTYSFDKTTSQLYGGLFLLDSNTGHITLRKQLDYEATTRYQLVVKAMDAGSISLLSYANIIVDVIDINDNAPLITVNTLRDDSEIKIAENVALSSFVAYVSVSDADSNTNGQVVCRLTPDDSFGLETIQIVGQYKIVTKSNIDRELHNGYDLSINCFDGGIPRQTANVTLHVIIADVNDNSPQFSQSSPIFYVPENVRVGSVVGRVSATDADDGSSGRVNYRLLDGGIETGLAVDWNTGVIETKQPLNFEKASTIEFTISAVDNGQASLTATTSVKVVVLDVNDESPTFVQDSYTFIIAENLLPGNVVGRVQATDADSPPYNELSYRIRNIKPSGTDKHFAIDSNNGEITTLKQLDREELSSYVLVIEATDKNKPEFFSITTVYIYVTDVNDHSPVISFPNDVNNTVAISNRLPSDIVIAQIQATDADSGDNGHLQYYIRNGNSVSSNSNNDNIMSQTNFDNNNKIINGNNAMRSLFRCDSSTGQIIVNADLSRFTYSIHNLTVTVMDSAKIGARNVTARLTIIVNSSLEAGAFVRMNNNYRTTATIISANTIAVICVASASGVLIVILLTAIFILVCRGRQNVAERRRCVNQLLTIACQNGIVKHGGVLKSTSTEKNTCTSTLLPHTQAKLMQMQQYPSLLGLDGGRMMVGRMATSGNINSSLSLPRGNEIYQEKRVSFRDKTVSSTLTY